MTHKPEEYMRNRFKRGTPEHLWHKWYNKLWLSYPKHSKSPRGEPPAFMRNEFIRDVKLVAQALASQASLQESEDEDSA